MRQIALALPADTYASTVMCIAVAEYLAGDFSGKPQVVEYNRDKQGDFILIAIGFAEGVNMAAALAFVYNGIVGFCDSTEAPPSIRDLLIGGVQEVARREGVDLGAASVAAAAVASAADRKNMN
jgi:hypothetical protein